MLDIKNMNDNEIINLIKLLKHELETRRPQKSSMVPTGNIRLTLESSITNEKGQVTKNEPKTILFETMNSSEIDAIFEQDGFYPILVNQLVERFKQEMWENQTGPFKMNYEDKIYLLGLIHRIQYYCPQLNSKDTEILNKIYKILGGK